MASQRAARTVSPRPLRRRRVIAGLASLVAVALITMGVTPTLASWNDREWVSGAGSAGAAVGTLDCANPTGRFATRGEGRALGGGLLGFDLDALAAASSMLVTNSGSATSHTSGGTAATPAPDAFANPVNVAALRAVNVNLGGGILQLPLDNATGAIGQYGRASSDGQAVGAAGYVTDNGGIALKPAGGYPDLATLSVSQLLSQINPAVASTLANVSDVSLKVGAVAGRASVDGCAGTWANNVAGAVTRDYLTAALRTEVTSPTVGALVTGVSGAITGLENAVNGLTSNTGVLTSIRNGVTGLVNGVLGGNLLGIKLGSVTIDSLSATIDTTAVRALLTQSFGDTGGVLTVSPSAGVISVDTAALLASAYPGSYSNGLNGLAPNTDLLSSPAVVTALSTALTGALNGWITRVNTALSQAIDAISISVKLKVLLQLEVCVVLVGCAYVDLVSIAVTTIGTLTSLTTSTSTTVLGIGLITPLIDA
ncbi:MAG: choice-of-anchor G family protein, partial [Actinobacteria bacterium]|nr:choice-of-anchor G family protein [Actinomycetota bacterium]